MHNTEFKLDGETFPVSVITDAGNVLARALLMRKAWIDFLIATNDEKIKVLYVSPEFRR